MIRKLIRQQGTLGGVSQEIALNNSSREVGRGMFRDLQGKVVSMVN
jgi:hypothetical protein